jgi:uncharacterized protein YqhQ
MQSNYTFTAKTNSTSRVPNVAAILWLKFVVATNNIRYHDRCFCTFILIIIIVNVKLIAIVIKVH